MITTKVMKMSQLIRHQPDPNRTNCRRRSSFCEYSTSLALPEITMSSPSCKPLW